MPNISKTNTYKILLMPIIIEIGNTSLMFKLQIK